jgi:hypothetical protein
MDRPRVDGIALGRWLETQLQPGSSLSRLDRLRGGSKKGVYRARFADGLTVVLYVWAESENFWPDTGEAPPGPESSVFTDAGGPDLFLAGNDALCRLEVRTPALLAFDQSCSAFPAALAVVEDVTGGDLQTALARTSELAVRALDELGDMLMRMHAVGSEAIGKLGSTSASIGTCERLASARADKDLVHAAQHIPRMRAAEADLRAALHDLLEGIQPRVRHGLIHGELGPDHVLLTEAGSPVLIDIEGLMYFDVEWEHAFLRFRFGDHYRRLQRTALDENRIRLYTLCLHLSLISGPLRLLIGDFPERDAMHDIIRGNVGAALSFVETP